MIKNAGIPLIVNALLAVGLACEAKAQTLILDGDGGLTYNNLISAADYNAVTITGSDLDAWVVLGNVNNSYTGGTTVEGGFIRLNNFHLDTDPGLDSRIGTGNLTLAGGGIEATGPGAGLFRFEKRVLNVTDSSYLGNRIQIGGNADENTLQGSGSLTKVGSLMAAIFNSNPNFSGDIFVQEGILRAASPGTDGAGKENVLGIGGSVTVSAGATLQVGANASTTHISNNVLIHGHGVDGNGALVNFNRTGLVEGTVTLGSDATLGNSGSQFALTLEGGIAESGGSHNLRVYGWDAALTGANEGTILSGAGTFTGDVLLERGKLQVRHAEALGADLANKTITVQAYDAGSTIETSQLLMDSTGGLVTVGTLALDLVAGDNFATVRRTGSAGILANTIILKSGEFAAFSNASAYDWAATGDRTLVIDGEPTFSRNLGLTNATDTLELRSGEFTAQRGTGNGQTGNATQAPSLIVSGGTLTVNDDFSSGLQTLVTSGTLQGNGTLSDTVIQAGGILSPGNSIGTLNFSAGLTLDGIFNVEVDGVNIDSIVVNQLLTLGGSSVLNISGTLSQGVYVFASYETLLGEFGSVNNLQGMTIDYNFQGLNQIALVPEPESGLLLLLGAALLFLSRFRKLRTSR